MITKIDNSSKIGKQVGGFGIQILYPGTILNPAKDTGFGTIGRIDHASVMPGTLIPMHPHRDDEILTYLRSGKVKHKDSEGVTDTISAGRMMLMNDFITKSYRFKKVVCSTGCRFLFVRKKAASLQGYSFTISPISSV
jgi:hypothetical protein